MNLELNDNSSSNTAHKTFIYKDKDGVWRVVMNGWQFIRQQNKFVFRCPDPKCGALFETREKFEEECFVELVEYSKAVVNRGHKNELCKVINKPQKLKGHLIEIYDRIEDENQWDSCAESSYSSSLRSNDSIYHGEGANVTKSVNKKYRSNFDPISEGPKENEPQDVNILDDYQILSSTSSNESRFLFEETLEVSRDAWKKAGKVAKRGYKGVKKLFPSKKPRIENAPNGPEIIELHPIENVVIKKSNVIDTQYKSRFDVVNVNPKWNLAEINDQFPESAEKFNSKTIAIIEPGNFITEKDDDGNIITRFVFISRIGYGGSCILWLVADLKEKLFKAFKVFKKHRDMDPEERILYNTFKQLQNHRHIMKYYDYMPMDKEENYAVYELLGKDLHILVKEARQTGGLHINVIKKIAKHILLALQTLHDECKIDGKSMLHCDIKPMNIASCISQKHLYKQLKNIAEHNSDLTPFRMTCRKERPLAEEEEKRKALKDSYTALSNLKTEQPAYLKFKLIDLGNAMKEGQYHDNGTPGYRPPEHFFRAKLAYSFDIWSLGVTLLEAFTGKSMIHLNHGVSEIDQLVRLFDGLPRRPYRKENNNGDDKMKRFIMFKTEEVSAPIKEKMQRAFKKKLRSHQMSEDEREEFVEFLTNMLHLNPEHRLTAKQLLQQPWLKNIE